MSSSLHRIWTPTLHPNALFASDDDHHHDDTPSPTSSASDEYTPYLSPRSTSSSENQNFSDEDGSLADSAYWTEEHACTAWLAAQPGGLPAMYPILFIPSGNTATPPSSSSSAAPGVCFLADIPPELRDRIYEFYFDGYEDTLHATVTAEFKHPYHIIHPKSSLSPFLDRNGTEIRRIRITTENTELKSLLSTPLLRASRQVRYEALCTLFEKRVVTIDTWLPALPRFISFLGERGRAMVRNLDIWDELNIRGAHSEHYISILTHVAQLPALRHLRIVLAWDGAPPERNNHFFSPSDLVRGHPLLRGVLPRVRAAALDEFWPEYEVLGTLKAHRFTMAITHPMVKDTIVEFDREHGLYRKLGEMMQAQPVAQGSSAASSSSADMSVTSTSSASRVN